MLSGKTIIVILILAAFIRFYKLESFPVSIYWDEAAIGYNAYSIAMTGRDEYGMKLPLLFKSFSDYKLPGYIYLDSVFIKILDFSIFSTRFPSALFGTLTIFGIYHLGKNLFDKKTALISAFFLAISPWHIQFSRSAFEATIAFTLIVFGLLMLLLGRKSKIAGLISAPLLFLATYFYLPARLISPLFLITFFAIFKKEVKINLRSYMCGTFIAFLIVLPIISSVLSYESLKHVKEVSIFEDKSLITDYVKATPNDHTLFTKIFFNYRIPVVFEVLHGYSKHFSPGFLFFGDDPNARHDSAYQGNMYFFQFPLILVGIWLLIKSEKKTKYLILSWLLISPLPAAVSKEAPHSLRSLQMLIPLTFISATGALFFLKSKIVRLLIVPTILVFLVNYIVIYYRIYPIKNSLSWGYGYQQMLEELAKLDKSYDRVIITGYYWKPYIYYLYFNKIDPKSYQNNPDIQAIGKYRFGSTYWDSGGKNLDDEAIKSLKLGKTLLVLSPEEMRNLKDQIRFSEIKEINDYSGHNSIFLIGEWQ